MGRQSKEKIGVKLSSKAESTASVLTIPVGALGAYLGYKRGKKKVEDRIKRDPLYSDLLLSRKLGSTRMLNSALMANGIISGSAYAGGALLGRRKARKNLEKDVERSLIKDYLENTSTLNPRVGKVASDKSNAIISAVGRLAMLPLAGTAGYYGYKKSKNKLEKKMREDPSYREKILNRKLGAVTFLPSTPEILGMLGASYGATYLGKKKAERDNIKERLQGLALRKSMENKGFLRDKEASSSLSNINPELKNILTKAIQQK